MQGFGLLTFSRRNNENATYKYEGN